jgi:ribose transport system permease protein
MSQPPIAKSAPQALVNARKELGIFALLILVCAFVEYKNHNFLGAENLGNLAQRIGMFGIFSIGAGVVIITGGIDLSVGSMFALLGVILAIALNAWKINPWLAVLLVVGGGVILGAFQGFLITKVKLQPFIVTLCGLLIYRGLARYVSKDESQGFGEATNAKVLMNLSTGNIHGVPIAFMIFLVIAAVMWVVVHRSVYGRYLFAVGRNEEAARYSGINSKRIIGSAYVVSGLIAGIAGIIIAFYSESISPASHGESYELYGIAAAVLGGCSLRGGEGTIIGILLGTALLQVLQNLVNLLGIPSSLNFAVVGAVILIGVMVDEVLKGRKTKTV